LRFDFDRLLMISRSSLNENEKIIDTSKFLYHQDKISITETN